MTTHLLDVNVLLSLSLPNHQHHVAGTDWFATGPAWATTPLTESAYVRLMTNPRVVGYSIAPDAVLAALAAMRRVPGHVFLADDTSLAEPHLDLGRLAGSRQVTDFHLLNLAARHNALLTTFDASLARSIAPADRIRVRVLP